MTAFDALLKKHEKLFAEAFERAMQNIRSRIRVRDLAAAIERGDLNEAIRQIGLDNAALREFRRALEDGFTEAGQEEARFLSTLRQADGTRVIVFFDDADPRAVTYLRMWAGTLISEVTARQVALARKVIADGVEQGDNPLTIALDIAGRFDRQAGRRVGGIIGLTSGQEATVKRLQRALQDGEYEHYFTLSLRDRRFDAAVGKAINGEVRLTRQQIANIVQRYRDRLTKYRASVIARTEALTGVHAGQRIAYEVAIAKGQIKADQIDRAWDAVGDDKVRDTHAAMDGQKKAFNEPFVSPSGARLMYPGDRSLGAPAKERISCRCRVRYRVNLLKGLT